MLLKDIGDYNGIYISCLPVDFRQSIDGLTHLIKRELKIDPFGNYLFLFCNKRRDKLKTISWDGNGFWLGYKRLDGAGARFVWPGSPGAAREITINQLKKLLGGLSVDPPRGFGNVTARDF